MIEARSLSKSYEYATAIEGFNLSLASGALGGVLGTSGSGASTVFKMLATLVVPSSGSARVAGFDVVREAEAVRRATGYLPDFPGVYNDLTPHEMLELFALTTGLEEPQRSARIHELLELAELQGRANEYIGNLSPLEQRLLALLRAMVNDPAVLLLDEPAGGLPMADRIRLRRLIARLHGLRKTVLVGSNLLTDLVGLCPTLTVMHKGRTVCHAPTDEVLARLGGARRIELEMHGRAREAADWLRHNPRIDFADAYAEYILCGLDARVEDPGSLINELAEAGFAVVRYREHEVDMDSVLEPLTKLGNPPMQPAQ